MKHKHAMRDLPKIRDSLSFLYFEYGHIEQSKLGVEFVNKQGSIPLPVASLSALLLGPGTSVTHAAIRTLAEAGCSVVWCGEGGVRCYAQGVGETHKAYRLMKQAELSASPEQRLQVIERMYRARFPDPLPAGLKLEQIRGREGIRVRAAYAEAAQKYGVGWNGRNYNRNSWADSDPLNRALSSANACLHGLVHVALLSSGYCPALGFIHQGKQLSFVYDVADLYKVQLTVPVAFAAVAEGLPNLETQVRKRCRDAFTNLRLLQRIVPDVDRLLRLDVEPETPDGFDPDEDPALPTPWWSNPKTQKS
ncbi:type I-E CRISPR-associated endonuclease Cas1 [Fibrella sp. HMF5335]|uniref:CRISPR-associated endonuclease Cas1 n=2 Tax=Fibrella rubiginis TaxID=2817060 RepID=A0A939GGQ4_9BACT|nr:type I-E CRISPR-associated endonuclease Cas1 [Fibrella rubiginis]